MTTHPFTSNPRSIGGMMCLVCNRTKTHVMHEGQGVAETDEQQEDPALAQEAAQQAAQIESMGMTQTAEYGKIYALPPNEPYLRIESNDTTTQIEMTIPGTDRGLILTALLEFMERIKPQAEQPEEPVQTRKKK